MNVLFENVTLAFTNCMTHESDFGGYSYSFVIDKDKFCETVRDTLALQKKPVWDAKKNTDDFILEKCNAKAKANIKHEKTRELMGDNDILVQVKSKKAPIENNKRANLAAGSVCDILIDVFEFEYGKRQFICIRSHASRGCTVKVKNLVEYKGSNYFEFEADSENGVALDAMNEYVNDDTPSTPF